MPNWSELQIQLQVLRERVPQMLRDHPDRAEFFIQFAGAARVILVRAPPDLTESVHTELGAILRDLQLADDGQD